MHYTFVYCENHAKISCSQAPQKVTLSPSPSPPSHWFLCSFRYFWRRHPQLREVELNFISLFWPFLPSGLQAAYEDFDRDLVYLFKGNLLLYPPPSVLPERWGSTSLCLTALPERTIQKEHAASQTLCQESRLRPHHGHKQQAGPSLGLSTVINKYNS